jgi:hypothetical protein
MSVWVTDFAATLAIEEDVAPSVIIIRELQTWRASPPIFFFFIIS